jgi:acyl carrier protein
MTVAQLSKEEVSKQLIEIIAKEGVIEKSRITPDATLESLGLDSMAMVMIFMVVEEKFNVYVPIDGSLSEVRNLGGLVDLLVERIQKPNA